MKKWITLIGLAAALAIGVLALATLIPVTNSAAQTSVSRSYVVPHFTEREGRITNTPYSFDSVFYLSVPTSLKGITLDIYLFDKSDGLPLRGKDRVVCNPCTRVFGGSSTHRPEIVIENEIQAAGGFTRNVYTGQALIIARGSAEDLDRFQIQYWLVNSKQNAFDLSWSALQLQPIPGAWR